MDEIQKMFDPTVMDFKYMGYRVQLLEKIPPHHRCGYHSTRSFLQMKLIEDANQERDEITEYNTKISAEIKRELPKQGDHNIFYISFLNWFRNVPENIDIQRVRSALDSMNTEYAALRERFINKINEIKPLKATIDTDIIRANCLIETLLEIVHITQATDNITELVIMADSVSRRRYDLIRELKIVYQILEDYNKKRMIWADLIVGIRDTLTSQRKPVAMTERTQYSYRIRR